MGKVFLFTVVVLLAVFGVTDAGKKGKKGKTCEGKKYDKMVDAHDKCLEGGFKSKLKGCESGDGKANKKVLKKCKKIEKRLKKCGYKCEEDEAVVVEWGEFGAWSECSDELGGCDQIRSRVCLNTNPLLRVVRCVGLAVESRKCEASECQPPPKPECDGGMVYKECGADCTPTCDNPDPKCPRKCVPKCECPYDIPYLLEGNCVEFDACPFEEADYKFVIMTSDKTSAGTDDKIFMSLTGDFSDTVEVEVNDPNKNDREKGSTDEHTFHMEKVGQIECITFRTDGTDGWNIYKVDVSEVGNEEANTFTTGIIEAWLDDKEEKTFCFRRPVEYTVVLKTADKDYADTDNWVYLSLSGTRGKTKEVGLDVPGKNDMMKGATDTHVLTFPDVGTIECAQFRIKGTDGWDVESVEIFVDGESAYYSGILMASLDDNATKRFCGNACADTTQQKEYRGTKATTTGGKTCQKWTSQSPQKHGATPDKYPKSGLGDHNYCRNPDGEPGGAWCYTIDPAKRWDYCGIAKCSS